MSAANWLHALAEDDALVEAEAVVVADAVELEEAELSVSRSSTIACTSASSSASRAPALDEEELEGDVDDESAAGGGPGGGPPAGGPPCGPPTACEAELALALDPSWAIRVESSVDIWTGWE